MLCTHCHQHFSATAVKQQRGKGMQAQVQCPLCDAWLGKNPLLTRIKMLAFYVGAISLCYYYWAPEPNRLAIPISLFAGISLLISHLMDHLKVVSAPVKAETNDDAHRQKYR